MLSNNIFFALIPHQNGDMYLQFLLRRLCLLAFTTGLGKYLCNFLMANHKAMTICDFVSKDFIPISLPRCAYIRFQSANDDIQNPERIRLLEYP